MERMLCLTSAYVNIRQQTSAATHRLKCFIAHRTGLCSNFLRSVWRKSSKKTRCGQSPTLTRHWLKWRQSALHSSSTGLISTFAAAQACLSHMYEHHLIHIYHPDTLKSPCVCGLCVLMCIFWAGIVICSIRRQNKFRVAFLPVSVMMLVERQKVFCEDKEKFNIIFSFHNIAW